MASLDDYACARAKLTRAHSELAQLEALAGALVGPFDLSGAHKAIEALRVLARDRRPLSERLHEARAKVQAAELRLQSLERVVFTHAGGAANQNQSL
ncbi:MAG: hypothetical protein JST92_17550 [Deltaproteobacteria bacterium]|nr:hypothetical protein [Deltaproteobacteria bacterium]